MILIDEIKTGNGLTKELREYIKKLIDQSIEQYKSNFLNDCVEEKIIGRLEANKALNLLNHYKYELITPIFDAADYKYIKEYKLSENDVYGERYHPKDHVCGQIYCLSKLMFDVKKNDHIWNMTYINLCQKMCGIIKKAYDFLRDKKEKIEIQRESQYKS